MRVLLTNDDGIDAKGLQDLYDVISKFDFVTDVWVVAPADNKSCCSHSMSFYRKIVATKYSDNRFSISGTPVDCMVVAIADLMRNCKPDVAVSGINNGANIDVDVTYSGTVAAAREASFNGVPSIAVSQMYSASKGCSELYWKSKDVIFVRLLKKLLSRYKDRQLFKARSVINVNLPCSDIVGVKCIAQGDHYHGNYIHEIDRESEGVGSTSYVIGTSTQEINSTSLKSGYIVVTPLGVDLTDCSLLDYIRAQNLDDV